MIEVQKKLTESHLNGIRMQDLLMPKIVFQKINFSNTNLFPNSEFLESIRKIGNIAQRINNNPEVQFAFITDLEILNLQSTEELKESLTVDLRDIDISAKETILNENLIPYLERLGIESLWLGANYVLDSNSNPDKLRHCLISLRTILEYIIDQKLAPLTELAKSEMFEKRFQKYNTGKGKIEDVKISRTAKIEYFTSKVELKILEDFTKNEIDYICNCYSILCNVHSPNIGITENQVRSLKVKTGITIWLLAYVNEIIERNKTHKLDKGEI
ncbi:hypothetical protein FNW52_10245 [Flavobacterium sp. ZT3R18]|nr:hypothetical protein FNW52_10245 [Flavobacterium sp. ZT3R18]